MANGRIKPTTDLIWRIGQKLRQTIDHVQPPDALIMVIIALIVGVGTGLGAVVFVWLLRQINQLTVRLQAWTGRSIEVHYKRDPKHFVHETG